MGSSSILVVLLAVAHSCSAFMMVGSARQSVAGISSPGVAGRPIRTLSSSPLTTVSSGSRSMRMGASASVIESVTTSLLKVTLSNPKSAKVSCKVQSSAMDLFRGNLKEAKVTGDNWITPAGMTLRTISLTLNGLSIKMDDVFKGAITFKTPATGIAVLSLSAEDFGNFLVHPLLGVADLPSGPFRFEKDYTSIDPEHGVIFFSGIWHGEHVILEASQPTRYGRFTVRVVDAPRLTQLGMDTLSRDMSEFFNTCVLSMDGTEIRFSDMLPMAMPVGDPVLVVSVALIVFKVPSPSSLKF